MPLLRGVPFRRKSPLKRGPYSTENHILNEREMHKRGLNAENRVDLVTASTDGVERAVRGLKIVAYNLPDGCCAAYYPETNPLVPLYAHDPRSHTPSSKAVPVRLVRTQRQADPAG